MRVINISTVSLLGLVVLVGCQSRQLTDPNAVGEIEQNPTQMKRNMLDLRQNLERRAAKREISPSDVISRVQQATKQLLENVSDSDITPDNAWEYGDLYRDAGDWKKAADLFDIARKAARTEDRKVNDNLRYARAIAHLGDVKGAIEAARSVFDAPPEEKAPILPAVLLEIVPEGKGKGQDVELAKLLEDAIAQHNLVKINPDSDAGKGFMAAKPFHVKNAWSEVIRLYSEAGKTSEARDAIGRMDQMLGRFRSL